MSRYSKNGLKDFGLVDANSFNFEISDLQQNLNDYGIPTAIDGVFGPGLSASVARFQLEQALPVTGQADDATVAKLVNIMADKARVSSLATQQPSQKIDMDPLYVYGKVPSKIPWWVWAGGALVAWKVVTR